MPALLMWAGAYAAGIHPTLAGVIVGLLTPVEAWYGREGLLEQTRASSQAVADAGPGDEHLLVPHLEALARASREALPPVDRLQHALSTDRMAAPPSRA